MKYIIYFLCLFSFYSHGKQQNMLTELSALKWQNRVILVKSSTNKNNILSLFKQNKLAINERDILWFVIQGNMIDTNYKGIIGEELALDINKQYKKQQGDVLLIGKDGRVKSSRVSVDLEAIFLEIDAMPMRLSEMNNL